jgi:hypothetical protein
MKKRQKTAHAVAAAAAAWAKAPVHFRAMAGAYVGPLLEAMQAAETERAEQYQHLKEGLQLLEKMAPAEELQRSMPPEIYGWMQKVKESI